MDIDVRRMKRGNFKVCVSRTFSLVLFIAACERHVQFAESTVSRWALCQEVVLLLPDAHYWFSLVIQTRHLFACKLLANQQGEVYEDEIAIKRHSRSLAGKKQNFAT